MSVGNTSDSINQDRIIRSINSDPEKLVAETRRFREEAVSRIRKITENLEGRCETHPGTEIRLHSRDSDENNRKDIRLIADSIVLFEKQNGIRFSGTLRDKINFQKALSENISKYTLSSEKQFDNHFRTEQARYDVKNDLIIFHHLPLETRPANYPKILEPLVNYIFSSEMTMTRLEDILVHEMTHSWLAQNSKLKARSVEALEQKEWDLAKVTANDNLYVIDECFANLTGWTVSGERPTRSNIGDYPEPEKIVWGTNILIEKSREIGSQINIIDWARKTEKRVFDMIMQKGQFDHTPMAFLLESALYSKDFDRLKRFHKIVSGELGPAFDDLKTALKHLEASELEMHNQISYQRLTQIEEEVDWHNADRCKSGILEKVIDEGSSKQWSLEEVSESISKFLQNESSLINEYSNQLGNLEEVLQSTDHKVEIEETRRELLRTAQDIEDLA